MNLLNAEEKIPDEFYVFVNFNNPITKHNIEFTKVFISGAFAAINLDKNFVIKYLENSIDYIPLVQNESSGIQPTSMFNLSIRSDYMVEYNCELYRRKYHPNFPSRFSCIYAFGDKNDCVAASEKYGWKLSTLRTFKLRENPLNRVVKANMEIISLERWANKVSSVEQETQNNIWKCYWNGYGYVEKEFPTVRGREKYGTNEIWEYLIEGQLELIGKTKF